ncbi:Ribosomal protein L53 mitochondrial [Trinorchestia longiramus]|nr:Ribosomal protein L53 mitochondrial [Trinorchestia longiramus]
MALPLRKWGSLSRSNGIYSAINKQVQLLNYGGAEKISLTFDPFDEVKRVTELRSVLSYMNQHKRRLTNPKCAFKTNIVCDRSPPSVHVQLIDGSEVLFKTENLSCLEVLSLFNELVSSKAPKKQEVTVLLTKAEKAAAAGAKKKWK